MDPKGPLTVDAVYDLVDDYALGIIEVFFLLTENKNGEYLVDQLKQEHQTT